ncbi:MAG: hypothetical protein Q4F29_03700, partial [Lachnospiraceae bacterium]|nr:hypothetical protein [Lachnospiraceae bacterium]
PYNQNRQSIQKPPANNMAVISLTLGIISMLLSCCCILPMGFIIGFALGMGGLVTAILSKNGQPFTGTAVAGLVISILGICLSLFIFGCYMLTAYMMRDPNYAAMIQQLMEQYQNSIAPQTIPFFLDKLF